MYLAKEREKYKLMILLLRFTLKKIFRERNKNSLYKELFKKHRFRRRGENIHIF